MLEIGTRQLNNWRLHEPPTSSSSANLAPCQHAYTVAWCHVITSDYQDGTIFVIVFIRFVLILFLICRFAVIILILILILFVSIYFQIYFDLSLIWF